MKKLILLTLLGLSFPSFGDTPKIDDPLTKFAGSFIKKYDLNADNFLTEKEFLQMPKKMFQDMDSNKDGKVSVLEMVEFKKREMEALQKATQPNPQGGMPPPPNMPEKH